MADDWEIAWTAVKQPTGTALEGVRAPGSREEHNMWLALDRDGNRHLLLGLLAGERPLTERHTKGLTVTTREVMVADRPEALVADLECRDPRLSDAFVGIASAIRDELRVDPTCTPREAAARVLHRWKHFWTVEANELTREAVLGLVGELWFLMRWLGGPSESVLRAWNGPAANRHDFSSSGASVEVKATAGSSERHPRHRVQGLEQLADPPSGVLYLFSLHLASDELGDVSLAALITEAFRSTSSRECERMLDERLAAAGWSTVPGRQGFQRFRVVAETLFKIDVGFPRLTRESFGGTLPTGVSDIAWTLDTAACERWRVATDPFESTAHAVRQAIHAG